MKTTTEKTLEELDGLTVKAQGFTMLAKVEEGQSYRLELSQDKWLGPIVTFYRPRGQKALVRHKGYSVLSSINSVLTGTCRNGLALC